MSWFIKIVGVGLVVLALIVDIYSTVLYPRGHRGVLSAPLSRAVWRLLRLASVDISLRSRQGQPRCQSSRRGRVYSVREGYFLGESFACPIAFEVTTRRDSRLLAHNGPMLLVAIVVAWVALLTNGFALIAWPALGTAIQANQGATPTDYATALYYSGYALTTLGTGDIVPKTEFYRLLMVLETVIGLSSLTLTLTYFQSVYSALIRRNTFALSLQHRTGGTADAAELLARLGPGENFINTRQDLAEIAKDLLNLLESDHTYPVLHYFHFQETYYALPRILLLAMETVTLVKTALDQEKYRSLVHSAAVSELWGGGMQLLVELSDSFVPKVYLGRVQPEQIWRERYLHAVKRLSLEGIKTAPDLEAGADLYVSHRQQWAPYILALTKYMAYEWHEVAPMESYWYQHRASQTQP